MKKWKEPLFALAFVAVAALLIGLCADALRPQRVDYGAVWGPYLAEPRDSLDYLYLGSSYAYCDVDPAVIYEHTGLTGYVLAGPEQTLSQTYWYLREALRTQSPSAVVLDASALHFDPYQNYTQVNVGYMPMGLNKLGAVFTASEPGLRTGLLFDLYFYHNRWKDVTPGELVRGLAPVGTDTLKGFTGVEGVFEQIADGPFRREEKEEAVYQANLADLGRIQALCQSRNIPLVVVFHPTYSQLSPEMYRRIGADVVALGARYYDWSDESAAFGIVPEEHFYDPGHLNRDGAAVFSSRLGDFFGEELGLIPRDQTAENEAAWEAVAEAR